MPCRPKRYGMAFDSRCPAGVGRRTRDGERHHPVGREMRADYRRRRRRLRWRTSLPRQSPRRWLHIGHARRAAPPPPPARSAPNDVVLGDQSRSVTAGGIAFDSRNAGNRNGPRPPALAMNGADAANYTDQARHRLPAPRRSRSGKRSTATATAEHSRAPMTAPCRPHHLLQISVIGADLREMR